MIFAIICGYIWLYINKSIPLIIPLINFLQLANNLSEQIFMLYFVEQCEETPCV